MDYSVLNGEYLERRPRRRELAFGILLGVLTLLVAFVFFFNLTVSVCSVEGISMMNTLSHKDTVLMKTNIGKVERGDIITISDMSENLIIKRVIGIEGDKLVFKLDSINPKRVELYRDSGSGYVRLNELDYIKEGMTNIGWGIDAPRKFKSEYNLAPQDAKITSFGSYAITVGAGECFVMGDNRNDSSDSRVYGVGKISNIKGKLFYKVTKNSILEKILLLIYKENDSVMNL